MELKLDRLLGEKYYNQDKVLELILSKRVYQNPDVIIFQDVKSVIYAVMEGENYETTDTIVKTLVNHLPTVLLEVYIEMVSINFYKNGMLPADYSGCTQPKSCASYDAVDMEKYLIDNKINSKRINQLNSDKDLLKFWESFKLFPEKKNDPPFLNMDKICADSKLMRIILDPLFNLREFARFLINKNWHYFY